MRLFRLLTCLCTLSVLIAPGSVHAGGIGFELALNGAELSAVNRGNSAAFYVQTFRLLGGGDWAVLPGREAPAELRPGATAHFRWREPSDPATALDALQPVMIRFFDQAGVSFGQVSFFHPPPPMPPIATPLTAEYADGLLSISPPSPGQGIAATWIIAAHEDGIAPLQQPLTFTHRQPAAQRIVWSTTGDAARIDLGAAMPTAILIHETTAGLRRQEVGAGRLPGQQQRAAWLDASDSLYHAALAAGLGAAVLLMAVTRRRGGTP